MRLYFLPTLALLACNGETSDDNVQQCDLPVAEAGTDITISMGEVVSLDASASTWCERNEDTVTAQWSFVRTPSESTLSVADLSENNSDLAMNAQFTPDKIGEYILALTINDGTDESVEDHVVVTVQIADLPPTADCGGSYVGDIGQIVGLDGSASFDPESSELEYSWSLLAPGCSNLIDDSIVNQTTANAAFVPDCDGVYISTLMVSDGNQWSEPAICSIDVASSNELPIADAGDDQIFGGCAPDHITLDGFGSYDLDGDVLFYEWSLLGAPNGSSVTSDDISHPDTPNPSFSWDVVGEYRFQLQVGDGVMMSAPDLVNIEVEDIGDNASPMADAGEEQELEIRASWQPFSQSTDCPELEFVLDATASTDPNGDSLTYSWTETSGALSSNGGVIQDSNLAITTVTLPSRAPGTGTTNMTFELQVSDCVDSDSKTVSISYSCINN